MRLVARKAECVMALKIFETKSEVQGYASYYENEITGLYLTMMITAQAERDLAEKKFQFLFGEYKRYRLAELKDMPYKDYLKTQEWQAIRKGALDLADHKCQLCSAGGVEVHVHHKNYERRGEEQPGDLIVLCKDCHAKHHGKEAN